MKIQNNTIEVFNESRVRLTTLRELVLVAQDTPHIEIHRRTTTGWERETHHELSESLTLQSVALRIGLAEIYA